jgi:hypothetical protein
VRRQAAPPGNCCRSWPALPPDTDAMQTLCSLASLQCYNHELPAIEGLSQRLDGILISGSHYSAYEGGILLRGSYMLSSVAAVGRRWTLGSCSGPSCCVVVATQRRSISCSPGPCVYIPLQSGRGYGSWKLGCARWWSSTRQSGCWGCALALKC